MLKARPGNVMNKDTYDILFVVRMSYWKGCIKEWAGTHKNKFYHLSPTNLLQLCACQNWLLIQMVFESPTLPRKTANSPHLLAHMVHQSSRKWSHWEGLEVQDQSHIILHSSIPCLHSNVSHSLKINFRTTSTTICYLQHTLYPTHVGYEDYARATYISSTTSLGAVMC